MRFSGNVYTHLTPVPKILILNIQQNNCFVNATVDAMSVNRASVVYYDQRLAFAVYLELIDQECFHIYME